MMKNKTQNFALSYVASLALILVSTTSFAQPKSMQSSYKNNVPFAQNAAAIIQDSTPDGAYVYEPVESTIIRNPQPIIAAPAIINAPEINQVQPQAVNTEYNGTYIDDAKYNYHNFKGKVQRGLNFRRLDAYEPASAKRITEPTPTIKADYEDGGYAPTLPVGSLQVETRASKTAPRTVGTRVVKPIAEDSPSNVWQNPDEFKQQRVYRGGASEVEKNDAVTESFFF